MRMHEMRSSTHILNMFMHVYNMLSSGLTTCAKQRGFATKSNNCNGRLRTNLMERFEGTTLHLLASIRPRILFLIRMFNNLIYQILTTYSFRLSTFRKSECKYPTSFDLKKNDQTDNSTSSSSNTKLH